jgi:P pilus assembly chaperone PapD
MKTPATLAVAFFLLLCVAGFSAPAQADISFSVSPIRVEAKGEPGGTYADAMEIFNEGSEQVRIKVLVRDWHLTENGTPIFEKGGAQARSCAAWLKINPVDFLLQPGEKKAVRYSVTIPADTPAGGYWGAFVFETVPIIKPGEKTSSVALKGNIASILYVTVGQPAAVGDIAHMALQQAADATAIAVTLSNDGTVPFRVKGEVKITDAASGAAVRTLPLPDAPVLAGYSRTFTLPIDSPLPPGSYVALATIDIGAGSLLAGEISFAIK